MGSQMDEAKGRAKEAAGAVTGDDSLRRDGRADQAGAKVKGAAESFKDRVSGAVDRLKSRSASKGSQRSS